MWSNNSKLPWTKRHQSSYQPILQFQRTRQIITDDNHSQLLIPIQQQEHATNQYSEILWTSGH